MPTSNRPQTHSASELRPAAQAASTVASSALGRLVGTLVAAWYDSSSLRQQRDLHRIAFEHQLVLTPLDDETEEPTGQPQLIAGRDLSLEGISFAHDRPLPFRKVAVTFALPDGGVESMVTRLKWCRFTRDGCYQSGGKFLRTTANPIDGDLAWTLLPRA